MAWFKNIFEFAFFHLGFLSEKIDPISPSEIVPSIESTKEWIITSASECPIRLLLWSTLTPPSLIYFVFGI